MKMAVQIIDSHSVARVFAPGCTLISYRVLLHCTPLCGSVSTRHASPNLRASLDMKGPVLLLVRAAEALSAQGGGRCEGLRGKERLLPAFLSVCSFVFGGERGLSLQFSGHTRPPSPPEPFCPERNPFTLCLTHVRMSVLLVP
ncbi:hypothetical protein AAFF_G00036140 [Aldrovandia affinis]|uniref:Uncharacterized protein n=1 Tax=Aldrovandia affinis TaxID=143900 RepID=A0AAD7WFR0_9TELE|nr:hypothetical protein AAFF_G00036140 [Aldrovandia affinis]